MALSWASRFLTRLAAKALSARATEVAALRFPRAGNVCVKPIPIWVIASARKSKEGAGSDMTPSESVGSGRAPAGPIRSLAAPSLERRACRLLLSSSTCWT